MFNSNVLHNIDFNFSKVNCNFFSSKSISATPELQNKLNKASSNLLSKYGTLILTFIIIIIIIVRYTESKV